MSVKGKLSRTVWANDAGSRGASRVHECVVQAVNQVTFSYRTSTEAAACCCPQKWRSTRIPRYPYVLVVRFSSVGRSESTFTLFTRGFGVRKLGLFRTLHLKRADMLAGREREGYPKLLGTLIST